MSVMLGLTNTVTDIGAPLQPLAVGTTVKVTVTGAFVVFTRVPDMLPDPEAAIPVAVAVLLRVQAKVVPMILLLNTIG